MQNATCPACRVNFYEVAAQRGDAVKLHCRACSHEWTVEWPGFSPYVFRRAGWNYEPEQADAESCCPCHGRPYVQGDF